MEYYSQINHYVRIKNQQFFLPYVYALTVFNTTNFGFAIIELTPITFSLILHVL